MPFTSEKLSSKVFFFFFFCESKSSLLSVPVENIPAIGLDFAEIHAGRVRQKRPFSIDADAGRGAFPGKLPSFPSLAIYFD